MNVRSFRCAQPVLGCLIMSLGLAHGSAVLAQQGWDTPPQSPPPASGYPPGPQGGSVPPGYPQDNGYPPGSSQDNGYPPGNPAMNPQNPNPQNPQMPGFQTPPPGGAPTGGDHPMTAMERQDFGVPPQQQLQTNLHGPTPTSIPGGQVVTTDRLLALYQQGQQGGGLLVFHVLGPGPTLPMAQNAVGASQPGTFNDQTQQEFGQYLQQVTQGNKSVPMVFYCQNTQCWMSYNAALRAINMGYTQVYWYRGGIEAWQRIQQMTANMQQQGGQAMPPPDQQGYASPARW